MAAKLQPSPSTPSPLPHPHSKSTTQSILRSWALFLFVSNLAYPSFSSLSFHVPYKENCNSIVPMPGEVGSRLLRPGLLEQHYGCFKGGEQLFAFPLFADLLAPLIYSSDVDHVFGIQTTLVLGGEAVYNETFNQSRRIFRQRSRAGFNLTGFWSESLGRVCLVTSDYGTSDQGEYSSVVLKLNYPNPNDASTIKTYLVSGWVESLSDSNSPKYFNPIALLFFSPSSYRYTLLSDAKKGCSAAHDGNLKSLSLPKEMGFCSYFWELSNLKFQMEYPGGCREGKCGPFGESDGFLPTSMSIYSPRCVEDKKLNLILEFSNAAAVNYAYYRFPPKTSLMSEGVWDEKHNRICLAACRILNSGDSFAAVHVDDFSIGLSLWVPESLSIKERSPVVGSMWSNKKANESGYFDKIVLRSSRDESFNTFGLKYEYTQTELARKSCKKKDAKKAGGNKYSDGQTHGDMQVEFSMKNEENKTIWGYADPLTYGEKFYENYKSTVVRSDGLYPLEEAAMLDSYSSIMKVKYIVEASRSTPVRLNVSYVVSFNLLPDYKWRKNSTSLVFSETKVHIFAEGIYDPTTGTLCMVGCQSMGNSSMDCEIVINIQFPPMNPTARDYLNGTISSSRNESDPLYFEPLELTSNFVYASQSKEWVWRMGMEVIMSIITLTLSCIFTALQIFHVRRHRDVLPSISLLTLLVLALGHIIPLVWNLGAFLFIEHNLQNVLLESGGWVQVNAAIVILVTLVAALLQCRLLHLAWSARISVEDIKVDFWVPEIKALLICLHLHAIGGLVACSGPWNMSSTVYFFGEHYGLWENLGSYDGLFLDAFLVPQILFNLFLNSNEKALSQSYYIGTTAIRTFSHAYGVYRCHHYIPQTRASYIYASVSEDLCFSARDITLLIAGPLFALLVYLQQRYGGASILPPTFRHPSDDKRQPSASNSDIAI